MPACVLTDDSIPFLGQAIAMTAPVVTKPHPQPPPSEGSASGGVAIAMTAPVLLSSSEDVMQFVLPEEFKHLEDIPTPVNANVQIQEVPSRVVAVTRFNGGYDYDYFMQHFQELQQKMQEEGFLATNQSTAEAKNNLTWSFAQYNPPFTIPYFRRNEVWIEMKDQYCTDKFRAMLQESTAAASAKKSSPDL